MGKNIMANVARQLGVELEEEFQVENKNLNYKFTENGLMLGGIEGKWIGSQLLEPLVLGQFKIIKLPWKPAYQDVYYHLNFNDLSSREFTIQYSVWYGNAEDYALFNAGVIYRTKAEAEAHLREDYKKLTGRGWSEKNE